MSNNNEVKKMWYESKTLWINIIGALFVLLQYFADQKLVDPVLVTTVLAVGNMALRLIKGEQSAEIKTKLF